MFLSSRYSLYQYVHLVPIEISIDKWIWGMLVTYASINNSCCVRSQIDVQHILTFSSQHLCFLTLITTIYYCVYQHKKQLFLWWIQPDMNKSCKNIFFKQLQYAIKTDVSSCWLSTCCQEFWWWPIYIWLCYCGNQNWYNLLWNTMLYLKHIL